MILQIPSGKEDVEALGEFLDYWREIALEAEGAFEEPHIDPEDAEVAAKAVEILWKSLADSIGAAMSSGELGIFRNYDEAEPELTSSLIDIVDEQPGQALTAHGIYMDPEPVDITEAQRDEYLVLSIFEIPFSVRIRNCLKSRNIETVRDLVSKMEKELLQYKGLGRGSLREIKEKLADIGLWLGMDLDDENYDENI